MPSGYESTEDQRRQLGLRIKEGIDRIGLNQPAIAAMHTEQLEPITQATVSNWIRGRSEPPRASVRWFENLFGLNAGDLSRHVGYLPASARDVLTVEQAINADGDLTLDQKEMLLGTYRTAARATRKRRSLKAT